MASSQNVENNITPMYVLLPLYTGIKQDVFFEILQKVVSRTKSGEEDIECAFASGMSAKTLFIKSTDLSVNCNDQISESARIRLVKALGFWTVNNFPSLGRKLLGELWKPLEERTINIKNATSMDGKQLDATMFTQIKLRVIELSVSASTWDKVKHFVAVPGGVCDKNPIRMSKKMKMYGIQDACIDDCWQALKIGKYKTIHDFEQPHTIEQRQSENSAQLISTIENNSVNIDFIESDDSAKDCGDDDSAVGDSADGHSGTQRATAKRLQSDPSSSDLDIVSASKRSRVTLDTNGSNSAIDNALNTDDIFTGNIQPSQLVSNTELTERNDEQPQSSTELEHIKESNWEREFHTKDEVVLACREKLMKLSFKWLKFGKEKKAKFCPGFIHPTAPGGKREAQKVLQNGYPSSKQYEFFEEKDEILESERSWHKNEVYALNAFNKKFKSKFQ